MVESTPASNEGELRKIKVKQLTGGDIDIQVNKDVSYQSLMIKQLFVLVDPDL